MGSFILELAIPCRLGCEPMSGKSLQPTITAATMRLQKVFQNECVELFTEVVQLFGVPKSVGQIYGILYASPKPLCFSDIIERLEISKGSASQGLQLLRALGAINVAHSNRTIGFGKEVEQKSTASGTLPYVPDGGRREYYEPELSLRKLLSGVLRERVAPLAATSSERLINLRELAEQDARGNEFYLDRAKQLEMWRRRLKIALPLLSALLGSKAKS